MGSDLHQPALEETDNKKSRRNFSWCSQESVPSLEKGRNWEVFGTDLVLCHSQTLPCHSIVHETLAWKIFLLGFVSFASVFPDFLPTCRAPFPNNQIPIFLSRTLCARFSMELEAKYAFLFFFFFCHVKKSVDFLPVDAVGPLLEVQREVWNSQWELSHKKKREIPVLQSN